MSDSFAMDLEPGSNIGGYRLLSRLGGGAMGSVWRVQDDAGNEFAMKILRDSLEQLNSDTQGASAEIARERLHREALALSRIDHPGVCSIVDIEIDDAIAFIVTALIQGDNLDTDVHDNGPYVADDLERLAARMIEAVEAVHRAGIIHRDIKPTNVMVAPSGPVLVDFGIAMAEGESHVTRTGLVMGTPGFIAPEIIDGAESDELSDWWSTAAVLAFAATGKPVFGVKPMMAVLERAAAGRADLAGLPPTTLQAFRSALHPNRKQRCSPWDLLEAISRDAHNIQAWEDAGTVVPPFSNSTSRASLSSHVAPSNNVTPNNNQRNSHHGSVRKYWKNPEATIAPLSETTQLPPHTQAITLQTSVLPTDLQYAQAWGKQTNSKAVTQSTINSASINRRGQTSADTDHNDYPADNINTATMPTHATHHYDNNEIDGYIADNTTGDNRYDNETENSYENLVDDSMAHSTTSPMAHYAMGDTQVMSEHDIEATALLRNVSNMSNFDDYDNEPTVLQHQDAASSAPIMPPTAPSTAIPEISATPVIPPALTHWERHAWIPLLLSTIGIAAVGEVVPFMAIIIGLITLVGMSAYANIMRSYVYEQLAPTNQVSRSRLHQLGNTISKTITMPWKALRGILFNLSTILLWVLLYCSVSIAVALVANNINPNITIGHIPIDLGFTIMPIPVLAGEVFSYSSLLQAAITALCWIITIANSADKTLQQAFGSIWATQTPNIQKAMQWLHNHDNLADIYLDNSSNIVDAQTSNTGNISFEQSNTIPQADESSAKLNALAHELAHRATVNRRLAYIAVIGIVIIAGVVTGIIINYIDWSPLAIVLQ